MSQEHKQRRNEHLLKNLPSEVLLKARSTLFSLSGALKPKHEHQRPRPTKQEQKEKKNHERLKSSRSEPEFSQVRKKHRSRIEEGSSREHGGGVRPRPMSVGTGKQYDRELEDFRCGSYPRDVSPMPQRNFDSTEEVCLQSRLVIPVGERLNSNQDVHMLDANERPRKKLSFREPEIVISNDHNGSATLGRSHKLMGVNSLTRRPNRVSLRSDPLSTSLDGLDSDLESQAMRIVRTVGQAFEVCHKMQVNSQEQPAPSTSSAADEAAPSVSDNAASKEAASECGGSEAAASITQVIVEETASKKDEQARPSHLDLLPPPPRKEGKRRTPHIPPPSLNLPDLPECVTKVDMPEESTEASTPLSAQHQLQLLRERLDQQAQQTRAAVAQLLLLRDQLAAEQSARCEAQARTHQLLVHNKELLEHIAALVAHLQDRERGVARPISAHQLTLLPQMADGAGNKGNNIDHFTASTGFLNAASSDALIDLFSNSDTAQQNIENNNNLRSSPYSMSPAPEIVIGNSAPCFGGMSNEELQNYLISKFQNMGGFSEDTTPKKFNANQQFYQNSNAFPNIPPLTNHFSAADLATLLGHSVYAAEPAPMAQAMSVGYSETSLFSPSRESSSKDSTESSSDEGGIPFIMPLSHNGTLTATGSDGRVRLIVPVSPSESTAEMRAPAPPAPPAIPPIPTPPPPSPCFLTVPAAAPITRTTSEKVPNRSEMMTALRSQWTRHTTK